MLFGEFLVLLGIISGSALGFAVLISRYRLRADRQKKFYDDLAAALATRKHQAIDDLLVLHPDIPKRARKWLEARRDQLFIENNP